MRLDFHILLRNFAGLKAIVVNHLLDLSGHLRLLFLKDSPVRTLEYESPTLIPRMFYT